MLTPLFNNWGLAAFATSIFNASNGLCCLEGSDTRLLDGELFIQVLREESYTTTMAQETQASPPLPTFTSPAPNIYSSKKPCQAKPTKLRNLSFENVLPECRPGPRPPSSEQLGPRLLPDVRLPPRLHTNPERRGWRVSVPGDVCAQLTALQG